MINFRWGQAPGQASVLNLVAEQATSRGLRKHIGWRGWAEEKEGIKERALITPTLVSSALQEPPPPLPSLPPNLAKVSG